MNTTDLYKNGYVIDYQEGDSSLERRVIEHREDIGDRYHILKQGENLTYLAHKYYGKPLYWYLIADVNEILNPLDIEIGTNLIIPNLERYNLS